MEETIDEKVAILEPVTYDELLQRRGYTLDGKLGEGSYAVVKRALSETHGPVAIKVIDPSRATKEFREKFMPRELHVHCRLNHANVIRLLDMFRISARIYIVLELATRGDLLEYVRLRGAVGEGEAKFIFRHIVEGLIYLHASGVAHRDLKCQNILLDRFGNAKIADFGFCRTFTGDELSKTHCGSIAYASPEVLLGTAYQPASYDMWSSGVILHVMLNGSMPFDDTKHRQMIRCQKERRIHFSSRVKDILTPQAVEMIGLLLEPDVEDRLTAVDCLETDWLKPVIYEIRNETSPPFDISPTTHPGPGGSLTVPRSRSRINIATVRKPSSISAIAERPEPAQTSVPVSIMRTVMSGKIGNGFNATHDM